VQFFQIANLSFLRIKLKFDQIKSAIKFLCVAQIVAESLAYLTVIDVGGKGNPST